jgi:hypothetical protein
MPSPAGLFGLVDDAARMGGRLFGKSEGPKYEGEFASDKFFQDLHAGDDTALRLLKDRNYSATWKISGFRQSAKEEMFRGANRTFLQKLKPRGLLTGYKHYGIGRASNTIFNKTNFKFAAGLGLLQGAFEIGSAPRGRMISTGRKTAGETAGGYLGAGVGALFGGLPGELIGGFVGAELGGKTAGLLDFADKVKSQGR